MRFVRNLLTGSAMLGMAASLQVAPAYAETVLKVVPHSGLKILDPIWTTAYISRNHGYMIYDTLFGLDAKGAIQPQMVDKVTTSDDGKTITMTLRDGLMWHDGKPVTVEDVIDRAVWIISDNMQHAVLDAQRNQVVAVEKTAGKGFH